MWKTARPVYVASAADSSPTINESGAAVSITPDRLQQDKNHTVQYILLFRFFVFILILRPTETLIKLQLRTFKQPKLYGAPVRIKMHLLLHFGLLV